MRKIRMLIPFMLLIFSTYPTISATETFSVPYEKYNLPNGLAVVGDAEIQLEPLEVLGIGKPELIK